MNTPLYEWALLGTIAGVSVLTGFLLGWAVSKVPFGFALGCLPSMIAPVAGAMLLFGKDPGAFGLGLWGVIPSIVGCGLGFVVFRNPKT